MALTAQTAPRPPKALVNNALKKLLLNLKIKTANTAKTPKNI